MMFPDREGSSSATFARQDCRHPSVCHSEILFPWSTEGATCVCDTQSLPTHHPLGNNTETLLRLFTLTHLFQTGASCISASFLWPPCIQSTGEEETRREGNKQVTVRIYRQKLWGAITHPGCEYHLQNNVSFKFLHERNLPLAYQKRKREPHGQNVLKVHTQAHSRLNPSFIGLSNEHSGFVKEQSITSWRHCCQSRQGWGMLCLTGRSGWGFIKRQWHWLIRNIRPWCAELCRACRPPGRSERASESIKQMPGGWRVLTLTGRQAHVAAHYNGINTLAGGGGGHLE